MEDVIVFGLSRSLNLTKEICEHLQIRQGNINVTHFADGEILVEPIDSVRGKKVFLIQSTSKPVSDAYMEVLIALDACKRASADEVTVVMPYYGYARQDRKARARQPITAKLMADLLQSAGADRVVTVELHAPPMAGFFNVPIDDLSATSIIGQYIRKKDFQDDIVIVSPDHGGATRARRVSDTIPGSSIAIIDKRRTSPNVAESVNLVGDVKNKIAIIVDDIVDTAGSMLGGVNMLFDKGAKEVYAATTHAVLSDPALERIRASKITELLVTNTIELDEEKADEPKIVVISIAYMLAKTIEAITYNNPVSEIWALFND